MIAFVFHHRGARIHSPLQALQYFLELYSSFDWSKYAITARGLLSAVDLSPSVQAFDSENFIPDEVFESIVKRFYEAKEGAVMSILSAQFPPGSRRRTGGDEREEGDLRGSSFSGHSAQESNEDLMTPSTERTLTPEEERLIEQIHETWLVQLAFGDVSTFYKRGLINVMNPVAYKNNLSRAVDLQGYQVICEGLREGFLALQTLVHECLSTKAADDGTLSFATYLRGSTVTSQSKVFLSVCDFMSSTCYHVIQPQLLRPGTSDLEVQDPRELLAGQKEDFEVRIPSPIVR